MKRSTRRKIFYGSIVFFLLACVGVLFYAQGYDFDPSSGHVSKTGGVSLASNVSAEVYLDDKLVGSTSLLQHSFSQSRLLPGKHRVELRKTDYQTWSKEFVVSAGFVFDLGEAFLPRSQAVSEVLLPNIKLVSYSSTDDYLAGWVGSDLTFYDLNKRQVVLAITEQEAINPAKLSIIWSGDNQNALVYDNKLSWLVDLGAQTYRAITVPRTLLSSGTKLLGNRLYGLGNEKNTVNNLVYYDFSKASVGTISTGVNSFLVDGDSLFFTDIASSTLWQVRPNNQDSLTLLSPNRLPAGAKLRKLVSTNVTTMVLTDAGLFQIDSDGKIKRLTEAADDFALSPDQSALVWSSNEELWMMVLKDNSLRSELITGKPVFLFHKGERIDDLFWLNNQYLYLVSATGLDLVEAVSQTQPVVDQLVGKNSEINSIVFPTNREKLIWFNGARLESAEF